MNRTFWFFHPISIFIFSILALVASLFLYIYWYIEVSTGLKAVVKRFNLEAGQVLEPQTWLVILVLSILVGLILLGIFTIFVYNQKTLQLYRLQHNFINNFTHELKTPVTSMKLFLETFLRHELSATEREKYIEYMLQDVSRLSENISRILNLAKVEAKSYEGEFISTDLPEMCNHFVSDNRRLFSGCRITIHHDRKTPLRCAVDRPLFEMLLMNLITNAIKYNNSDVPGIDVSFEMSNGNVTIRFADNGIGLDRTEIKKIFRKFYQIGRPLKMTTKGSGLGLYLVQSIARIHKGKIVADSPGGGKGSTFTLTLPC